MKYLKLFVVVLIISLFGILTTGCVPSADDPKNVTTKNVEVEYVRNGIVDYGNDVYYFNYTEAAFGNAVSKFREDNPELELITSASDDTDGYGHTAGYFVFFKKKDE